MSTELDRFIDYYQWFVLAGLIDHPGESVQCSLFWFANKPLRAEMFKAITRYKNGPVQLINILDDCENVKPIHIFDVASSPRPYKGKLRRYIRRLESCINEKRKTKIIEVPRV